jgi:cytidylate kinase
MMAKSKKTYDRESLDLKMKFGAQFSISGLSAVGTSATMSGLREKLPDFYRFISGGAIMREKATELGMTIEEFCVFNKENLRKGYDRECDKKLADFCKQDYLVGESRLFPLWSPRAFKVRLICPENVASKRRFLDLKKKNPDVTLEEVTQMIRERNRDDAERYNKLYPGWDWGDRDFDLVVDTSIFNIEEVVERILAEHKKWLFEQETAGCLLHDVVNY